MIYTDSDNISSSIGAVLTDLSVYNGLNVADMLSKCVKLLDKAVSGSRNHPVDFDGGVDMIDDEDVESEGQSENYDSDQDWDSTATQYRQGNLFAKSSAQNSSLIQELNARIRDDLAKVKEAGFRVGHLGALFDDVSDIYLTISCRVAKLCISDEAMQAWHLEPDQYFILIMHYTSGYATLEALESSVQMANSTRMRVGLSRRYKITLGEAIDAFTDIKAKHKGVTTSSQAPADTQQEGLQNIFIGGPLDELLNNRLVTLLKYRSGYDFYWTGAERFYNDHRSKAITGSDMKIEDKYLESDDSRITGLPSIVTSDHFIMVGRKGKKSFPLLAFQYALRHLVRCTEFCLVCHCKVDDDFEALKPYVCSNALCLYQYMALGFGPSIEYEILTQPHVVDLLVSFCYASANQIRLKSFPDMGLKVPHPSSTRRHHPFPEQPPFGQGMYPGVDGSHLSSSAKCKQKENTYKHKAVFDRARAQLIFSSSTTPIVHTGNWIYVTVFAASGKPEEKWHCKVTETLGPIASLGKPIFHPIPAGGNPHHQAFPSGATPSKMITPAVTPPPPAGTPGSSKPEVEFVLYDTDFDELNDVEKNATICALLDTLPSIGDMKSWLQKRQGKDTSLRDYEQISPAALGVLRWILASNRSCIVQVDDIDGSMSKSEERVSGMQQWMQFRFAQGAPDKEQRFITAVRTTCKRLSKEKYPTIFAWHGSPLRNWHSIVREGLNYEETQHGRAFGHGVYFALDASTSLSYSGMDGRVYGNDEGGSGRWSHSRLKISSALTLNEVVNAPSEFVSNQPHLVVSQLDWIQPRYLFVKCNADYQIPDRVPSEAMEQDPQWSAKGPDRNNIIIPITAISKSRRPLTKTLKNGHKKARITSPDESSVYDDDVFISDVTDEEDAGIFKVDNEETAIQEQSEEMNLIDLTTPYQPSSVFLWDKSKTNFVPGSLDHATLPLLDPPEYATSGATRTLQKELGATLKVQKTQPLHELGWYINPELVTNVYQWIVELHSFDPDLPLAVDMKKRGIRSVVMEIRFGQDYPISPPFVRVIRPRFLGFMNGGGGHVTAGGALCMELLTNSGWSAVSSIESVLLQVRMAITSVEPKPARLENGGIRDYGIGEAVEAYIRACNTHGVGNPVTFPACFILTTTQWKVPKDFHKFNTSKQGPSA